MRNNDTFLPGLNSTPRRRGQRTGYLRAVNGTWLLTYRQYVFDSSVGKTAPQRRTVSIGPARAANGTTKNGDLTKKQAERFAWEHYLAPLDNATTRPGSMLTLGQFWEMRYEAHLDAKRKYATASQYKSLWRVWIQPALGSVRLCELTPDMINTFCADVLNSGKGTATVRHIKKVIGAVIEHARMLRAFSGDNPARSAEVPHHVPVRKPQAMTIEQCRAWLGAVSDERRPEDGRGDIRPLRTMSLLGICCGLGISEQLGLRWGRVNLTGESLIRDGEVLPARSAAIVEHCYHGRPGTLKTGSRRRNVPLPEVLVTALARLHSETAWKSADDPVFAGSNGKAIWGDNLAARTLKPKARALGIPFLSYHIFRHTFATLAQFMGMLDVDRRAMMGHTAENMTGRYTHIDFQRLRASVELLANEISSAPRKTVERAEPDPKLFAEFFHG